jgi:hypothetical protein
MRTDFTARAADKYRSQVQMYNKAADAYRGMAPQGANLQNIAPLQYSLDDGAPLPKGSFEAGGPEVTHRRKTADGVEEMLSDGTVRKVPKKE